MKQRLTALAIVTAFFLFSVAFGFIIGKALNKTSIVDTQCIDQLKSCSAALTSGENLKIEGGLSLGISAPIPEAPGFMRYMSNTGLTFVYPATSSVFEKNEQVNVLETVKGADLEISLYLANHDKTIYKFLISNYAKSKDITAEKFITDKFNNSIKLLSTDKVLRVKRYVENRRTTAPVNSYANDYNGYTGSYFIEYTDQPGSVAAILTGSDSIFDNFMPIIDSISMVKK